MTHYLSRLRMARNPQVAALVQLLNPDDANRRMDAHHRLLWSVFSAGPQTVRDFLWRHDGRDGFLVLSARQPQPNQLFDTPRMQEFSPNLRAGDRLAFVLRANATRTQTTGRVSANGKPHKAHIDLVMDALHPIAPLDRADARMILAQEVAERWLGRQGQLHGFHPDRVMVSDYSVLAVPTDARRSKNQPRFGVLDMEGALTVTEPEAFLRRLISGFGRAKAFGCGLMLIRRA